MSEGVVTPEPLNGQVRLTHYDPAWPAIFDVLAARIRTALGARVLAVRHAGSTSVPGLAAKPVIDIVLEMADSGREADYAPALQFAGFVLRIREPAWFEHRCFKATDPAANLHVFSAGCPETRRMLAFRDRLRSDDADRLLYETTKRALAQRSWATKQDYADAKSDVVAQIMQRALP